MTITSQITRIKNNISNAYTACQQHGATMPISRNSDNLPNCINSCEWGIPREIVNGELRIPENYKLVIPDSIESIDLKKVYVTGTSIEELDFNNVATISNAGTGGIYIESLCKDCTNLKKFSLGKVPTIKSADYLFQNCSSLETVDFSSLTQLDATNYAYSPFAYCFDGCTSLREVKFDNLTEYKTTTVNNRAFYYAFNNCTSLKELHFPSLTTISTHATTFTFMRAFYGCLNVDVYFEALETVNTGVKPFNRIFENATNCNLHFPSNLSDTLSGITTSGTNCSVLFDLPATA